MGTHIFFIANLKKNIRKYSWSLITSFFTPKNHKNRKRKETDESIAELKRNIFFFYAET